MEDLAPLATFSLTHVHYNPQDPISYLCAWLALIPQGLCITYVTLIWATREAEIILMFVGQMGCEVLNFLLKRLIKEERPRQISGKGYGMPSSHAQFLGFFATYLSLFLLIRHRPHSSPFTGSKGMGSMPSDPSYLMFQRYFISTSTICVAICVALSRIYLNYHTPRQVFVGSSAGASTAVAWFLVTEWARRYGWVNWGLEWSITRWFRIRDLVIDEDLSDSGWREWEDRREQNMIGVKHKRK